MPQSIDQISPQATAALRWIIEICERRGIPLRITGGLAAKVYGSSRVLHDIDIDIPDEYLGLLSADVEQYYTMPLQHYKDAKWNLRLMTLDYQGQEIDVGGSQQWIANHQGNWIKIPICFDNLQYHQIGELIMPIINPHDLIAYKQYLDGEHQQIDIQAIQATLKARTSPMG
jgi:hypothetical protein